VTPPWRNPGHRASCRHHPAGPNQEDANHGQDDLLAPVARYCYTLADSHAVNCLARISHASHCTLHRACRGWQSTAAVSSFASRRSCGAVQTPLRVAVVMDPSGKGAWRWLSLACKLRQRAGCPCPSRRHSRADLHIIGDPGDRQVPKSFFDDEGGSTNFDRDGCGAATSFLSSSFAFPSSSPPLTNSRMHRRRRRRRRRPGPGVEGGGWTTTERSRDLRLRCDEGRLHSGTAPVSRRRGHAAYA
jgi:hypothetical protein